MRHRLNGFDKLALVIGGFAVATVILTYPQAFEIDRSTGLHGDALLGVWRLAWIGHSLAVAPTQLFNANIFDPEPRTFAYSDALLLPGTVAAPLHWAGVPPLIVYNCVVLTAFLLSALSMCWLVRSLTGNWVAGGVAGLAFAFSSHQLEHFERLELQLNLWMPLTFLAICRASLPGRTWLRDGCGIGVVLACQLYSGIYHGIFLLAYVTVVGPIIVATLPGRTTKALQAVAIGVVVAIILVLPYVTPYRRNAAVLGERSAAEIRLYSATLQDYFAVIPTNWIHGTRLARFGHPERMLFPGSIVAVLALLGVRPRAAPVTVAFFCGAIVAIELSRGTNSFVYTWLHDHVFLFRGLRAPARAAVLFQFSLAALAGFGVTRVFDHIRSPHLKTVCAAVLLMCIAAEYGSVMRLRHVEAPARVYQWLRRQPRGVVLELPLPRPSRMDASVDVTYMFNSTVHWYPLVNGYSGFVPDSYFELLEMMRTFPDSRSLRYLRSRRVKYIFVHERDMARADYVALVTTLNADPRLERQVGSFEERYEVAAFQLRP